MHPPSSLAGGRFLPLWILRRPVRLLAAMALPLAFLAAGLLRLETDNSAEVFFSHDSASSARYQEFLRAFGNDDAVRLVASGDDLWTPGGLARLAEIEARAAEIAGVRSVRGLASRHRRQGWPPVDPAAFARRVRDDRIDRNLGLVGRAGDTVTVLVDLTPQPRAERTATLDALRRLTAEPAADAPAGIAVTLAGGPVLDHALDGSSGEIGKRYFPLLVVLASLLLAATFRRLSGVWVPLAFVAAVEATTLGAMGWAGVRLNLVLAVLPPLLFVVALATAVHVLVRFRDFRQEGLEGAAAVAATYRDKGWSVLWTGVTTLVGFASLAASPVGPVRSLGIWSAVGIAAMTAFAFTLLPALLRIASRGPSAGVPAAGVPGAGGSRLPPRLFERRLQRCGRRWAEAAVRRRWAVLTTAAALAAVAAAGIPRLEVESNALRYLHADHPARAGIERLAAAGIGVSTAELLIELPEDEAADEAVPVAAGGERFPLGRGFATPAALVSLAKISARVRQEAGVLGALSAGDVFAVAMALPTGRFRPPPEYILERLAEDAEGHEALAGLLADGGRTARVTVFIETAGRDRLEPLFERLVAIATEELAEELPAARAEVTGKYPLLLEAQGYLLKTLALSLSLTLLLVALIFRLILGTTRMTLLAMLPNVWPVLGVVGTMGWLGLPLDVATVMVASVVLGLAVDDTIHTLGHFRQHSRTDPAGIPAGTRSGIPAGTDSQQRCEAIARTLEATAPAYVLTGLILVLGFGVCAVSDFAPTARFGALAACAVALAVLGDLVLLPALLGATPRGAVRKAARHAARGEAGPA